MLLGITNGGKVGLGVAAGLLIAFAILSAFYFPRRNPDYPGNRLGLFIALSAVLFVVTMAGVWIFASEEEPAHGAEATETQPTETGESPGGTVEGDATAGEAVFASTGCGGCHALEAAGSSGAVGPNLDESQPDAALVVDRVTNGAAGMPAFGDELDEQQIQDVAAYVVASTQR